MAAPLRGFDLEYTNPFAKAGLLALWLALAYAAWLYLRPLEPFWIFWVALGLCGLAGMSALSGVLVGALFLFEQARRHREMNTASGAFANGRMASISDLAAWGMTDGPGLFLGLADERTGTPIFHDPFAPGEGHMMTFALNRSGKTSSLVIPALLSHTGASLIVTDAKGELAPVTIRHRQTRLGQNCIVLDPFGATGCPSAKFNVLDILADDLRSNKGRRLRRYLKLLTEQLVPDVPDDKNGGFFEQGARNLIIGGILYHMLFNPSGFNLTSVQKFVAQPDDEYANAAMALRQSDRLPDLCAEYAAHIEQAINKDYKRTSGSFFTKAQRALSLYADETLASFISASSFHMADILDEHTTIYISLGTEHIGYAGPWMGLIVTFAMDALASARGKHKMLFLLDEAGTIGQLPDLQSKLPQLPGKGLRVWFMLQSDEQLNELYGERVGKIIMDNCSLWQAWGFRRESMVQLFSFLAGKRTHKAKTFAAESEDSKNFLNENVSENEVNVLHTTDILHAKARNEMYIYSLGRPMIRGYLMPFWKDYGWHASADPNPIEGELPAGDQPCFSIGHP